MTEKAAMKKPLTLLAFREARRTLGFVLPVDSRGHNNFRAARVLPRKRRGYGRKLGAVILYYHVVLCCGLPRGFCIGRP